VSYLELDLLPGGCFFTAEAAEFDERSGPVRDAVAGMNALWQRDLRIHIRRAVSDGDLPPDTDADQLVYAWRRRLGCMPSTMPMNGE
jgi:hypothetical protein